MKVYALYQIIENDITTTDVIVGIYDNQETAKKICNEAQRIDKNDKVDYVLNEFELNETDTTLISL